MKDLEIKETDIVTTVNSCDRKQNLTLMDDLVLELFLTVDSEGIDLILCSLVKGDDQYIQFGYWVLSELIDEAQTDKPIILLQQLAIRFGLAHKAKKF